MKKLFTLLTLLVALVTSAWAEEAVISWNMGANGEAATGANSITGASGCDAVGFTIAITGNTGKIWYAGNGDITYNTKTYKTLKNSNGAQNTITCPSGKVATQVVFYVTSNADSSGSLTEIDGTSCSDAVSSLKDYENPTVITKSIDNKASFTFTFSTKQVCFIAVVTYTNASEDVVANPSISLDGSSLTMSCVTDGATVHYTLDGSEPTASSPSYSTAITLENSCTVRAKAFKGASNEYSSEIVKRDCYVSHSSVAKYIASLGYNGGTVSGDVWTGTNFVITNNVADRGFNGVSLAGTNDGFKLNHTDSYTIQPSEGIKVTKLVVVGKTWLKGDAGNASTIAFDDFTPASGSFFDYLTGENTETYVKTIEFTPSAEQTYGQAITMRPGNNQLGAYIEVYGDVKTYTVTYDAGANGTGSIAAGEKTHGVAFTLSSSTFTRDGFTQTGWATSDGGPQVYALGGSYTANADITLYPVWSKVVTNVVGDWDFTNWSDATKTGVLGDNTNWNRYEKAENAGTDLGETGGRTNVFALSKNTIKYGSTTIPETNGLKFTAPALNDGKNFALVFDKKNILTEYDGNQYIWLMSSSAQIVVPDVEAGSVVSVDIESHKTTEERTITVKVGSTNLTEKSNKTGATTKTTMEYNITADGDVTIAPSSKGLHILKIKVTKDEETIPVSTKADRNYATCIATKQLDFASAEGITAYIATGLNGAGDAVELSPVDVVPAGTPIIVKTTTQGATVNVPVTDAAADDVSGNALVAGDGTTAWNGTSGYNYYYLASDLFHLANAGTLQSGKAYLKVAETAAPVLNINFGETTGISTTNFTNDTNNSGEYYNLAGQRVAQPTKGLYIVNGKKYMVK